MIKMINFLHLNIMYIAMLFSWLVIPKLGLNGNDEFYWFCISFIVGMVLDNAYEMFLNEKDEKKRAKKLNKKVIPRNSHINLKTKLEFNYTENLWELLDNWAKKNNYKCISVNDSQYTYGKSFYLGGVNKLKIRCLNSNVAIETWYERNSLLKLGFDELGIESGDLRMIAMRKKSRYLINDLLHLLNQNPIL